MRSYHGSGDQSLKVTLPAPAATGATYYNTVHRSAYTAAETAHLLGGISLRSLRRLEQRGLLLPSRGLRTKLYSIKSIEKYLEETI